MTLSKTYTCKLVSTFQVLNHTLRQGEFPVGWLHPYNWFYGYFTPRVRHIVFISDGNSTV